MNTLSGVLFFLAFLPYAWAIVQGETVPSPVTWGIWAIVDLLALKAMKKDDPEASVGQLTGAVAGATGITALAIYFGKPTFGTIEVVSIIGALLGIVLWKRSGNPKYGIILSNMAIFVGSFPEFNIAYNTPQHEDAIAWSIWLVSCVCALLAVKKWDIANALQPITFTVIETVMVFLVVIRPLL